MSSSLRGLIAASLLVLSTAPVFAEGDVEKGAKIFKKCQACHSVEEGAASKAGPNLHGIVGRKSAAIEGFAYSAKMKALGEEGHIWSEEELDAFLENPKKVVPGTKMSFAGLKKPEERADVIAYLASVSPAADGAEAAPAEEPTTEGDSAAEPAAE